MSDLEKEFEPIKFPIDSNTAVHVARYEKLVNIFYDFDDQELNLTLKPLDAIKFAALLKSVADEIIDEGNK